MSVKYWMIYGANGFTGELIAREARERGLTPILAGRDKMRIPALGQQLGLAVKVFDLDTPSAIIEALAGIDLLLHCAGPFSATSTPMVQACLAAKTHYLDINGEIEVFERIRQQNVHAKQRQVMLMPGVGFDVVATDCLALNLKKYLPDATELALAFEAQGRPSSGTAKTNAEGLRIGGKVRENGILKTVPYALKTKEIPFRHGRKLAATIAWGDISTAYHTTGIPNIEVYKTMKPGRVRMMKGLRPFKAFLASALMQNYLKTRIAQKHKNPDTLERGSTRSYVWGQVRNVKGNTKTAHLELPNSYEVTKLTAIAAVECFMRLAPKPGVHTPASVLGEHFIRTIPGIEMHLS